MAICNTQLTTQFTCGLMSDLVISGDHPGDDENRCVLSLLFVCGAPLTTPFSPNRPIYVLLYNCLSLLPWARMFYGHQLVFSQVLWYPVG